MPKAALDHGLRPHLRNRAGESEAPVGDHHLGWGDLGEQRRPRRLRLGSRHMPGEHVPLAPRDEDDEVPGEVYAVDEDDPVDLVDALGHGPYPPEPPGAAPEASAAAGHRAHGFFAQPPSQEGLEFGPVGAVPDDGRTAARRAPPPLPPGAREPVLLELGAADGNPGYYRPRFYLAGAVSVYSEWLCSDRTRPIEDVAEVVADALGHARWSAVQGGE